MAAAGVGARRESGEAALAGRNLLRGFSCSDSQDWAHGHSVGDIPPARCAGGSRGKDRGANKPCWKAVREGEEEEEGDGGEEEEGRPAVEAQAVPASV
ncbi:hypothetical protein CLOM_g2658 [Closterium sp. NIES-68]|nr:hypothetical protein CLOM_g2658 [Closterium sp. NIES-68]